jgi:hypothetical protein
MNAFDFDSCIQIMKCRQWVGNTFVNFFLIIIVNFFPIIHPAEASLAGSSCFNGQPHGARFLIP